MKLTNKEEKVMEVIYTSIKMKEKKSVASIAKEANVAPSLVIKVAKKLGYSGLMEMYYRLRSGVKEAISVNFNHPKAFQEENLDIYLYPLCELLFKYKSDRIVVNSRGDAEYAQNYLLNRLWERGFNALPYRKDIVNNPRHGKPGMMIVINERGVILLDSGILGKEKGYTLISITGNSLSPLALHSDLTIQIHSDKSTVVNYKSNLFVAHSIAFMEVLFAQYDEYEKSYFKSFNNQY